MRTSMEVRQKVIAALGCGGSGASIARRFEISDRTVTRLKHKHQRDGDLTPGKPEPTKLTEADEAMMREQVARAPGITTNQLRPMPSVDVTESAVCRPRKRALRRLNLRVKKNR